MRLYARCCGATLNRFDRKVVAPFGFQPTLNGLRGSFGALGFSIGAGSGGNVLPIGQGAGKGAETGAVQGASLGTTIMPGIGTAIGAVVGAAAGAIAGAIGKKDPEINNFDQAIALWQVNPDAIYQLANKYLVLAGFFDLTPQQAGQIRIYRKYGRMGEEPFTKDFALQIYNAAQLGVFGPNDNAGTVYQKVILPWENLWGFGPEPPNPHSDFMDRLLTGMIFDYATGYGPGHWFSRSGPLPASFSSIPPFAFPQVSSTTSPVQPVGSSPTTPPATTTIQPVGSSNVIGTPITPTAPTPQFLVSTPPAMGTTVGYAPDMAQGGIPVALPAGLFFSGVDPYNKSWILRNQFNQTYVLWQGSLVPYSVTMFAPSTTAVPPPATTAVASAPPPNTTIGTTTTGQPVTQADIQNLANQLAAQGQTAQQAYQSALQALQSQGVAPSAPVQAAVQSAVDSTPAPAASDNTPLLIGAGVLAVILFSGNSKRGRR